MPFVVIMERCGIFMQHNAKLHTTKIVRDHVDEIEIRQFASIRHQDVV